ncbi:MAG: sigma 54-interacting transcriptional regulator [Pseudomonadota bacterium]|nr:sigma 54-interacting transcriptional regulator [Pseudomonadota bacterium]
MEPRMESCIETRTELLANGLDTSDMAVLCIDPVADQVLECNATLVTLTGFTRDQIFSMPVSILFANQFPSLVAFSQACIENKNSYTSELNLICADDSTRPVEVYGSVFEEHGKPRLLFTLFDTQYCHKLRLDADATRYHRGGLMEWKRIEEVFSEFERENQLILNAAGEGIYGVNTEGVTTFLNPAAEKMLGYSAAELVGLNAHEYIHHSHEDGSCYQMNCCPIFAAFHDGVVHQVGDEVFWRKDGSSFPVEYTSTPIEDQGRVVGAVVLFRDVSERREADRRLRAALSEVESLKRRLELENAYLQEEIRSEHNYREIVGRSNAIRNTIAQIELVAPTDANVLITGESGTGKELLARAIHEASERRTRPLIRVNCAAIPRDLFESEFFGHVKGAFTGATSDRIGRFELADGGTLFLDEVGEIPLELQGKLLRVLQEKQFERVGDTQTRGVDVRVIAATNRDLKADVSDHRFREDLYFRLNVFPIESAPLRKRSEDIPLLATYFIEKACRKQNKPVLPLSIADVRRLQAYNWPGNIRELENVIERAVIVSGTGKLRIDVPELTRSLLPVAPTLAQPENTGTLVKTEEERRNEERNNVISALQQCGGKVSGVDGAARLLGMKPTTLYSRIQRWRIDVSVFKNAEPESARALHSGLGAAG